MVYFHTGTFGVMMGKVPFYRFITTFLLFNKDIPYIVEKLKEFGYNITDSEVGDIFAAVKGVLPQKYREMMELRQVFNINDPDHVQWLKYFDVFEFYDYIVRKGENLEAPPDYFKWCEDCLWIHKYKDVMSLVNILLFNKEGHEEISKIIMFKYRKKVGIKTIELYEKMFWNTDAITAKEALYFCEPFRNNALIVRQIRGGAEVTLVGDDADTEHDGSDVPFTFHDANYIKWKIGYREVSVPAPRDFLEEVKKDSYFKYQESKNMTQSVETQLENGRDDKLGDFEHKMVKHRNVEEQKAKMMKHYLELYLKAEESMPAGGQISKDFFEKMRQLELDFEDDEKIARIDDMPDVLNDIKGDMSGMSEDKT